MLSGGVFRERMPRRSRATPQPRPPALGAMAGVTYDIGALVAAERNDRAMWALHAGFRAKEVVAIVPAPVLAEGLARRRPPSQPVPAARDARVEPTSEDQARRVGVLAGKSAHDDIVDITVVEGAARRDRAVVTSNAHIRSIAEAAGTRRHIEHV